ncbi:MAG: membrane protein insertase YidC [Anaerolineales bacterium]|nr:membrane protein insertase YidC [Anaerolineales bacterium]
MSQLWNLLLQGMVNALLFLYNVLGNNFALSVAVFTILVRLITLPLTLPAQRSAKVQQELQPELEKIRKKYAKDKEKQTQETMQLYKEKGINPMMGCLPMLLQLPIMFAFYQSIVKALANTPLQMVSLGQSVSAGLSHLVPLGSRFLWLDLGYPDPLYVLPILVVATTWIQQKMTVTPSTDSQAASMTQSMQITMPLMFGFITMSLASGLAVYFVISNLVGIAIQYFITGTGGLLPKKDQKQDKKGK